MAVADRAPLPTAATVVVSIGDVVVALDLPDAARRAVFDRLGRVATVVDPVAPVALRVTVAAQADGSWRTTLSDGTEFSRPTATAAGDRLGQVLHGQAARLTTTALYVHAGVVAFGDRLVLLPGRSGSGKSTLVAAALRRGATYWSDEYAVIDPTGLVHPYPRPLVLRSDGRRPARGPLEPERLGATVGTGTGRAAAVVVTTYEDGATWRPHRVGGASAALPIIDHTVLARRRPAATTAAAAHLARTATVVRGPRGDADIAAAAIEAWVDGLEPGGPEVTGS